MTRVDRVLTLGHEYAGKARSPLNESSLATGVGQILAGQGRTPGRSGYEASKACA